jgi:hypothetical protein
MNDDAVVQLLTEIRDNQLRDLRLREEHLALSKAAFKKTRFASFVFVVFFAGFIALLIWMVLHNQQTIDEWREWREHMQSEPVYRAAGEGFCPSTGASLTV